ncbi:hypothetical protein [Vibrio parahaemolyticus]|uniref:hypothetical protein n=1 Tax=Vibrio parahaemolyticus TaxID=670 RepID=UPI003891B9B9
MNQVDFANAVGVSKQAVSKAIKSGRLDVFPDGEIELDGENTRKYLESRGVNLDDEQDANVSAQGSNYGDANTDVRLNRAVKAERLKTERLRQEKLKLELSKEKRSLISYAFVETNIFGYLDALSDALLEAPDTLIDTLHQNWEGLGEEARDVNMNEISEFITIGIEAAKAKILAEMTNGGNSTQ